MGTATPRSLENFIRAKDLAPEVARHVLHHVSFSSRPSSAVSHQEILQLTGFFHDNLKACRMMILLPAVVDFFRILVKVNYSHVFVVIKTHEIIGSSWHKPSTGAGFLLATVDSHR